MGMAWGAGYGYESTRKLIFLNFDGGILKNSNLKLFLLNKGVHNQFFDQVPLVSAGPHYNDSNQLFVPNTEREVSWLP